MWQHQQQQQQQQQHALEDTQRSRRTACFTTHSLAVPFVLAIYISLYCIDVFVVIVPWLSYSVPGMTNLIVLTTSTGLALWCYLFCVFVDPGRVPDDWSPDPEVNESVAEVKRKSNTPRFCQKCVRPKPPRAHHCRVCKRCVLRMDHHCPWTNNCVGHANYKAFLLCLLFVAATKGVQGGPSGATSHPTGGEALHHHNIWLWALLQTLAFAMALPLAVALLMLLLWHIQLSLTNKTSIEFQEGVTALIKAKGVGERPRQHIYDLGACTNLHVVLGDDVSSWVSPPCTSPPGGLRYSTAVDNQAPVFDQSWDAWLGGSKV